MSLTILSSDTTSLLDTNESSHLEGVATFWNRIEGFFLDAKVQSIRVVFVTGNTVVAQEGAPKDYRKKVDAGNDDEVSTDRDKEHSMQDAIIDCTDNLSFQRAKTIATIITSLVRSLESKAEETFKIHRSHILFDAKHVSRMDVSVTTIDRTVGFHRILQQWSNDFLATSTMTHSPMFRFQLPETLGFDGCTIDFQASYKVLPFPVNSPFVQMLYHDLDMLSRATFEAVQLVPISSVCVTLLHGIAITLIVGLGNSMEQHHENSLLSESLFQTLGEKDCALLVVARSPADDNDGIEITGRGLFHSPSRSRQHFLLMPEFIDLNSEKLSNKGILYRIASADYILDGTSVVDVMLASNHITMNEMNTNSYKEFVEASLDSVKYAPLNPLCIKTHDIIDSLEGIRNQKRVTWNGGVGEKQVSEDSGHVDYTGSPTKRCKIFDNNSEDLSREKIRTNDSLDDEGDAKKPAIENFQLLEKLEPKDTHDSPSDNPNNSKAGEIGHSDMEEIDDSDNSSESCEKPSRRPTELPRKMQASSSSKKEDSEVEWNDSSSESTSSSADDSNESSLSCTFDYASQ
jgi:hypothetical protein